ncbi:hypothetical protein [Streptomyces sp. WMMB303]|uniref:hypothetical protein n=1 Tax=Streptomyces sp. WMMB303 TaxID=3034154 RepID=UPI0023EDF868|nr:hypothetical protein [Streptomyces sp. WMMB303]MDF4252519.1 hypothetical protein [Streptomyces sp. WMMB303]
MTTEPRMAKESGRARGSRGPRRTDRAALCWATAYAGFGLVCALTRTPLLRSGSPGASASGWAVLTLGTLAALTCAAVSKYGPRRALLTLLWTAFGLAGLAAFGLLMDVLSLVFGQGVDSRAAAAHHAPAAAGAFLLAATARAGRPAPVASAAPVSSTAPRPVRHTAWVGTAAFLPYVAMKQIWALGGTFAGRSGAEMRALSERNGASGTWLALESRGLDGTMLLAALGVLLLWGLVRPWGQVFPALDAVPAGASRPALAPADPGPDRGRHAGSVRRARPRLRGSGHDGCRDDAERRFPLLARRTRGDLDRHGRVRRVRVRVGCGGPLVRDADLPTGPEAVQHGTAGRRAYDAGGGGAAADGG